MVFAEVIMAGMRYGISFRALALVINLVLQVLNMDHLLVSKSGIEKWHERIGKDAVDQYEKQHKG